MPRTLAVLIGGVRAGHLTQAQRTEFTYHEAYVAQEAPTPLSLSMPISSTGWTQAQVLPWLDGLLPDSRDVRQRWADRFGVSPTNPFALLGNVGLECPGAVQICADTDVDDVIDATGGLLEVTEDDVAERLATLSGDAASWSVPGERWSLGGAQSKFALSRHGERWYEATGSAATTHIIKPGVAGFAEQALNEHLCMSAARLLGIPAAETSYVEFAGRPAIAVKRYDRVRVQGVVRRIHQEDMCQALSVPARKKYETDGGPGTAVISDMLRVRADEPSHWRFIEAVAFNYLIGASDAHAKNYSVLLSGNQVRLAPLYDVASSLPYDPQEENSDLRKTAMAIAGQRNFGMVDAPRWHKFAVRSGVDPEQLRDRVLDLSGRIPDAISTLAADLPSGVVRSRLTERFLDRLERHLADVRHGLQIGLRPIDRST